MKKSLFAAIALALATMPLTFAAQAPKAATPAGTSASTTTQPAAKSTKKTGAKTHHKKSTKAAVTTKSGKTATASAAPVKK